MSVTYLLALAKFKLIFFVERNCAIINCIYCMPWFKLNIIKKLKHTRKKVGRNCTQFLRVYWVQLLRNWAQLNSLALETLYKQMQKEHIYVIYICAKNIIHMNDVFNAPYKCKLCRINIIMISIIRHLSV